MENSMTYTSKRETLKAIPQTGLRKNASTSPSGLSGVLHAQSTRPGLPLNWFEAIMLLHD
jgi:hypothetical protein